MVEGTGKEAEDILNFIVFIVLDNAVVKQFFEKTVRYFNLQPAK